MRHRLIPPILTAVVIAIAGGGWLLARAAGSLGGGGRAFGFFAANSLLMFDMVDMLARVWFMRSNNLSEEGPSIALELSEISEREARMLLAPYAIIASVHNASDDIDRFIEAMTVFKASVWLIDDASRDETVLRLRNQGWRCVLGKTNRKKPGALYELVKSLPPEIETVLVLDPDVRFEAAAEAQRDLLERVLLDFQRSGAAGLTPRIIVQSTNWLSDCQALEYEICCGFGRKNLANCSTCAGVSVYRRSALLKALGAHTLSVYAEDLENSILLLAGGETIYYDDRLVFVTAAKTDWHGWFSQRVGWSFGWAKVFWERMPQILAVARRGPLPAYQYVAYLGVLGMLAMPLKLAGLAVLIGSALLGLAGLYGLAPSHPVPLCDALFFPLCFLKSAFLILIVISLSTRARDRWRHVFIAPMYMFYALAHLVPMAVGFLNVLTLKLWGGRLYADHYDSNPRLHSRRELKTPHQVT